MFLGSHLDATATDQGRYGRDGERRGGHWSAALGPREEEDRPQTLPIIVDGNLAITSIPQGWRAGDGRCRCDCDIGSARARAHPSTRWP